MRVLPPLLLLLAFAPLVLAAPGTAGPFAGVLAEGGSATHTYDNHPPRGVPCPQSILPYWYNVGLQYEPRTAVVTLTVEGIGTVQGVNGRASISFEAGDCIRRDLTVTVVDSDVPVTYLLGVSKGNAPDS